MRNAIFDLQKYFGLILLVWGLSGCASQPIIDDLQRSIEAYNNHDFAGSQLAAESYIASDPTGPKAAEAYYRKGRAIEDRTAGSLDEARKNLQEARSAYVSALTLGTSDQELEGYIRASLADVAYWQEDFTTAAEQGQAAYSMLEDENMRAWTLYRAGISQQRLGKFEEADNTLGLVVEQHPATEPAMRAQQRKGVRAFNVQAATFIQPALADTALNTLKQQGFNVTKQSTSGGKIVIMVGPFNSYPAASTARLKIATTYPNALIVP